MKKIVLSGMASMTAVFIAAFCIGYIDSLTTDYWGVGAVLLVATVTTLVAFIVFLFIGIPFHILLKSKSVESLYAYVVGGAAPGIAIVYIFKPFGNDTLATLALQAGYLSFLGMLSALVFWFFYYKKRT